MINKLPVLLLFVLSTMIACQNNPTSEKTETQKPNIVFILADDLGIHDLGVTGSNYYETPYIDQLAKEGTVFTQGYAASRVCSPSRASILTGQFTARHGITDWIGAKSGAAWRSLNRVDRLLPADYEHNLQQQHLTLAEAFKEDGYQTFFAGKWHLGDTTSTPEHHGFEINKGGWDKGSPMGGYFSPWDNPKLPNEKAGENLSMRLAKETANFIAQSKDQPFLAYLSFYAVHGPIQTTRQKWKKYRDKAVAKGIEESGFEMEEVLPIRTVQDNPVYAGLVEHMDDAVGMVLKKLKSLGLEENTIVVFTSDNGGVASGDAYSTSNLPVRGGKGYQWEGGTRVPFFIKAPFVKNAAKEIHYPVINTDFYPTLLQLAGLDLKPDQHQDGISLLPFIKDQKEAERNLVWHYPHYGNQGGKPSSVIRKGNYKLIHYWEDEHDELYDLSKDIDEQNNLATQEKEVVSSLHQQLDAYLSANNANIPEQDSLFNLEQRTLWEKKQRTVKLQKLEAQRLRFLSEDFEPNEDWWGSLIKD